MSSAARDPVLAYVGLGANLGQPEQAVRQALRAVGALPGTRPVAASSLWRSAPVQADGPLFVNAVLAIFTRLPAPELLDKLQNLEQMAGRQRPHRNAPRTLGLGVLLYGSARIGSPRLTVPRPRLAQGACGRHPRAEIAPARVTAADLAAVAGQWVERLPPLAAAP